MKQDKALDMLQISLFRAQAEVLKLGHNASFFKQFGCCEAPVVRIKKRMQDNSGMALSSAGRIIPGQAFLLSAC